MTSHRASVYRDRDVLLYCGQSNSMGHSEPIAAWPWNEWHDTNSLHCSHENIAGEGMPDWDWSTIRPWNSLKGGSLYSIVGRMRARGMRPAVAQVGAGATHSTFWYESNAWISAYLAAQVALLTNPTVRALAIYQGESDAVIPPGTSWRTHWEICIAAIRSALSLPNLPVIVTKIPTNGDGVNGFELPYRAIVRADMDALVAADGHAVTVDHPSDPTYIETPASNGLHLDYISASRIGKLIADAIPCSPIP